MTRGETPGPQKPCNGAVNGQLSVSKGEKCPEANPARTLILDFQHPALRGNSFLLLVAQAVALCSGSPSCPAQSFKTCLLQRFQSDTEYSRAFLSSSLPSVEPTLTRI